MAKWLQKIKEANAKQALLLAAARKEDRAFTAEEQAEFDTLSADIKSAQAMHDAEKTAAATTAALNEPAPQGSDGIDASSVIVKPGQAQWKGGLSELLLAARNAAVNPGAADERLYKNASGHSVKVAEELGFAVGEDMMEGLWKRTYEESALAGKCTDVTVGPKANRHSWMELKEDSRAAGSRYGGVAVYWVGEGDTITASKATTRKQEINLDKLVALTYMTEEGMEDALGLVNEIKATFPRAMAYELDDAILTETGAGRPLGVLNSDALVSVAKETAQAADSVVYENIKNMWARLWAKSRANAVWYINQDCEPHLHTMAQAVGTGGVPVYLPANGISGTPYSTLYGRPVIPIEQCKTVGTVGDIVLADMSQYKLVSKGGIKMAESIHVKFLTDERAFRWVKRVGGRPIWANALTPANGTNTLSPFVALASRD